MRTKRLLLLVVPLVGLLLCSAYATPIEDEHDDEVRTISRVPRALEVIKKYNYYRLPHALRPEAYTLKIITHLKESEELSFDGLVTIRFKVLEDTHNITLHSQNLTIDESQTKLTNLHSDETNCIKSTSSDDRHDYYIMNLCQPIKQGEEYSLVLIFKAPLSYRLHGYYRSSYHDKATNHTRWLAVTQFEPASARAAFPCFDEPEYKAKFKIILGHHKDYTALSNMPLKSTKEMSKYPDWVWSEFEESVPMSTYLVAYTINDFEHAKSETSLKSKVQFRTWARRDAIGQCDYAGVVGPQVLQYFEKIFDTEFPLPKIDQIAIPDFSAGAMENWGLVTYRETALLYADNRSSLSQKQRVASVIAHELAHQWFGNLVTMKWWTDLWLNEGFATYVASLGVEHISPEWKSYLEESVHNLLVVFKTDALKTSHPISQPIYSVSEISQIFDHISYKKGSTVLRMMHMFLGDEAFHSGIHAYLQKYAYSNAEQDNLWAALTVAALKHRSIPENYDIKRIMDSWTLQTGYPVVTITRDYDKHTATVTQERYLLDTEASRSDDHNCWWVPLSYTTKKEANFETTSTQNWLECDDAHNMIPKVMEIKHEKDEWFIFNLQMSGLYKVKYDEHNWNLLIETLMSDDFNRIHIINRAQLIDDALSLAWSGDQDYDVAMRLMEYLKREHEYIPWKAALDNLGSVNHILRQTPEYEFFKKYIRKIIAPIYLHLHGLNETAQAATENHSSVLHKVLIAGWACRFEVDDCVTRAQEYFVKWQQTHDPDEHNPVPTDLRSVVYCTAMRHGSEDEWQFLWERYKNSNVAAEKSTMLSALGCTREVWLLLRLLEWSFDETSAIRKQDSYSAFGAVAHGEVGYHLAKDYFLSNFDFIYNFYEPETTNLVRILSPIGNQMSNKRDYEIMKAFTEEHKQKMTKVEQGVSRILETIRINIQWKDRNYKHISHLLKNLLAQEHY